MNKIYRTRTEKAVSPVIATILMVAITVVLAATVYIMVAGMGGSGQSVIGNLNYLTSESSSTTAKIQLSISQPSNPEESLVSVKVYASNDTLMYSDTVDNMDGASGAEHYGIVGTYLHYSSDSTHVSSGDVIKLSIDSAVSYAPSSFGSYKVVVTISGYEGTITTTIPA